MFIAMNRFRVAKGSEAAFEQVWMSRDSHLEKVPGFVEFHLLKGPEAEDHTLYASHTVWENRAVFEAWTKSEAFRAAHSRAGDNKPLYLDHPQFEGFEVRLATDLPADSINDEIALSAWSTLFIAKSRTCGGTSIVIFGSDMSLSPLGSFPRSVPC